MERYHFWLFDWCFEPAGFQPCSRVIHCRVDPNGLRIDPPGGGVDRLAVPDCEAQDEAPEHPRRRLMDGSRFHLPPEAIRAAAVDAGTVHITLDGGFTRRNGLPGDRLYVAALDPFDERLGVSPAENRALWLALGLFTSEARPLELDPNPYHRSLMRMGRAWLIENRTWNPAVSPLSLRDQAVVQDLHALRLYREFRWAGAPVTVLLGLLTASLEMRGEPAAATGVGLLGMTFAGTLAWLAFRGQGGRNQNRRGA